LGGGGTDLPSYYRDHGGFLVAAVIDKYVYITLHKSFQPGYIIKYSELERVDRTSDIRHPIVRAALELVGSDDRIEIASMADIPAGTGLGSSGTFTTALLRALHTRQRNVISPHLLAEQACHIEIDLLREPVGKQDQFIAAYGGVTCFEFNKDDSVAVTASAISHEVLDNLEDGLCLFFTGYTRSASAILKDQDDKSKAKDGSIIDNLQDDDFNQRLPIARNEQQFGTLALQASRSRNRASELAAPFARIPRQWRAVFVKCVYKEVLR
jgi:D-glycero-alpha-D-manno-heptose-7-phosphate kinase